MPKERVKMGMENTEKKSFSLFVYFSLFTLPAAAAVDLKRKLFLEKSSMKERARRRENCIKKEEHYHFEN